jgi:hypothetical protein
MSIAAAPPPDAPERQPSGRPQPAGEVKCPNPDCGALNSRQASFCVECGADLRQPPAAPSTEPSGLKCPACGTVNPPGAMFCYKDGVKLGAEPAAETPAARAARLVLPDGSEILLKESERVIGRGDFDRAVAAEELKYISRQHHCISFQEGRFYVEDQGSANGTKINGKEIKGQGRRSLTTATS